MSDPTEVIRDLRQRALDLGAAELGIDAVPTPHRVWGVLTGLGFPEGVVTLGAGQGVITAVREATERREGGQDA